MKIFPISAVAGEKRMPGERHSAGEGPLRAAALHLHAQPVQRLQLSSTDVDVQRHKMLHYRQRGRGVVFVHVLGNGA